MNSLVHSAASGSIPVEDTVGVSGARARAFAVFAHGGQEYGDQPYVHHLDAVAAVVRSWNLYGAVLDAAYLHDVLEDTDVSHAEIASMFGRRVADMVWAVTSEGSNRTEGMSSIYAKVAKNGSAAVVKLADRIANIEAAEPGSRHAARYRSENEAFSQAIKPLVPAFAWRRYESSIKAHASRAVEGGK